MCKESNIKPENTKLTSSENSSLNRGELTNAIFAKNMKFFRHKAGLNQKDIAKYIGASQASVQRWEMGLLPKGDHLIKLSEMFGCSIDTLLKEDASASSGKDDLVAGNDQAGKDENDLKTLLDRIESRLSSIETRLRIKELEDEINRLRSPLQDGACHLGERKAGGM